MKIHIVQKGDTLWKIAKKYGVNFEELKKMNSQLSNPDMIMPGMKIKVPTAGGMVKKGAPAGHNPGGIKKEMPIAEHPFAKEKPLPIVEAPVKEAPIIKEVPIVPYTPKMPTIPEIDINNYYMMNMANMTVVEEPQPPLPPKPIQVLPEIKEVPKQEIPAPPVCPPPLPVEQPLCEPECVPVTPVMPGPGFCLPFDPVMPYPPFAGAEMAMSHGTAPGASMPMPMQMMQMPQGPVASPGAPMMQGLVPGAGTSYVPPYFEEESSSFMPQMPAMNPGYVPGGFAGGPGTPAGGPAPYVQTGMPQEPPPAYYPSGPYQGYPAPGGYYPPSAYPQGGYPEVPGGYPRAAYPGYQGGFPPAYPANYPAPSPGYAVPAPPGYGAPYTGPQGYAAGPYPGGGDGSNAAGNPAGEQFDPRTGVNPAYGNTGYYPPYGQMPYGYPPQGYGMPNERNSYQESVPAAVAPPAGGEAQIPGSTGHLDGHGRAAQAFPSRNFVPATPPVYMAPYTAPEAIAQPPFMNPYGMEPMGAAPYAMPRDDDESDENGS